MKTLSMMKGLLLRILNCDLNCRVMTKGDIWCDRGFDRLSDNVSNKCSVRTH